MKMELYSDAYYISRIKEGDAECFGCLLDRYSRRIFALIVRIVENREDAEEITQDVFLKVFKTLASFKAECSFSTWIYRIAWNTAVSETRRKKDNFLPLEENLTSDDAPESSLFSDDDDAEKHHRQLELLDKALTQLPTDERAMILLFYKDEKTIEELAIITGLTEANVKVKLFRIRKRLSVLIRNMEEKDNE